VVQPATISATRREPELLGQTVVLVGGSAGIGLETARRARAEGADVVLTGRDSDRRQRAASELDARSTAAFDATDAAALTRFFSDLSPPIDHVMVTAGRPHYAPLMELDLEDARRGRRFSATTSSSDASTSARRSRPVASSDPRTLPRTRR
jgi:NADP-dependent 3-hydroxy acid dehydrogenase YdfG